jgi:hypothetical protein
MWRKLRTEYPEAMYHVMNRGDQRQGIFRDDHNHNRYSSKQDRVDSWEQLTPRGTTFP